MAPPDSFSPTAFPRRARISEKRALWSKMWDAEHDFPGKTCAVVQKMGRGARSLRRIRSASRVYPERTQASESFEFPRDFRHGKPRHPGDLIDICTEAPPDLGDER